jgi:hypothetical protein
MAAVPVSLLLGAATAQAAGGLSITSHSWKVGIANGPSQKVAAGKSYTYCTSKQVASLAVDVVLASTPKGTPWAIELAGPPIAGKTPPTDEGDFDGKGGVVSPAFITLAFPKLKADGVSDFPPGKYTFMLLVAGRAALEQSVTLVIRGGC